jgi:WD40 repeat protein
MLFPRGAYAPQLLKSDDPERHFHSQEIRWIRLLRDGSLLSLAGDGGGMGQAIELVRWDLNAGKPVAETFEPATVVTGLVISPDERMFVTTGAVGRANRNPGFVHIWDMQEFRHIATLNSHRSGVTAAAFSPDGKLLATGDIDGFVRTWDLAAIPGLPTKTIK